MGVGTMIDMSASATLLDHAKHFGVTAASLDDLRLMEEDFQEQPAVGLR